MYCETTRAQTTDWTKGIRFFEVTHISIMASTLALACHQPPIQTVRKYPTLTWGKATGT